MILTIVVWYFVIYSGFRGTWERGVYAFRAMEQRQLCREPPYCMVSWRHGLFELTGSGICLLCRNTRRRGRRRSDGRCLRVALTNATVVTWRREVPVRWRWVPSDRQQQRPQSNQLRITGKPNKFFLFLMKFLFEILLLLPKKCLR